MDRWQICNQFQRYSTKVTTSSSGSGVGVIKYSYLMESLQHVNLADGLLAEKKKSRIKRLCANTAAVFTDEVRAMLTEIFALKKRPLCKLSLLIIVTCEPVNGANKNMMSQIPAALSGNVCASSVVRDIKWELKGGFQLGFLRHSRDECLGLCGLDCLLEHGCIPGYCE